MTFKREMQELARELLTQDPDLSTVSQTVYFVTNRYSEYDVDNGEVINVEYRRSMMAVVGPVKDERLNANDVREGDVELIVPFLEATNLHVHPGDDSFEISGQRYDILGVSLDPSEVIYRFRLRPTGNVQFF
jgi:hypothetical protein